MVLWGEPSDRCKISLECPVLSFSEVLEKGSRTVKSFKVADVAPSDTATLVYTSGTTGHPKGVMLTHANLMYQVANLGHYISIVPGDASLSLLPPWHIYERSCGYILLAKGACQVGTAYLWASLAIRMLNS